MMSGLLILAKARGVPFSYEIDFSTKKSGILLWDALLTLTTLIESSPDIQITFLDWSVVLTLRRFLALCLKGTPINPARFVSSE
jgi:hypothetical protein